VTQNLGVPQGGCHTTIILRNTEILRHDFPHATSPNQVFVLKNHRSWVQMDEDDDADDVFNIFFDHSRDDDHCDIHSNDDEAPDEYFDRNDDKDVLGWENRSTHVLRTNREPKPWTKVW